MINLDDGPFGLSLSISILVFGSVVLLLSGCGETRHEEALRTARTLMSTGGLSDTEAVQNLETSDQLLERLANVKVTARQDQLYVLEQMLERYEKLRMWSEAAETVDKLIRLQPTEISWRLAKGRIYSRWSQVNPEHVSTAREAFETALELNPDSLEAKYGLGVLLSFRTEDLRERGRSLLNDVANHTPVTVKNREIIKEARFALGRFHYEQGQVASASDYFRQITTMGNITPESRFMAHRNLGRTYLEMGDRNRAREQLRQAYELQPSDPEIRRMLTELGVELDDL